jgi:hypothetical protein
LLTTRRSEIEEKDFNDIRLNFLCWPRIKGKSKAFFRHLPLARQYQKQNEAKHYFVSYIHFRQEILEKCSRTSVGRLRFPPMIDKTTGLLIGLTNVDKHLQGYRTVPNQALCELQLSLASEQSSTPMERAHDRIEDEYTQLRNEAFAHYPEAIRQLELKLTDLENLNEELKTQVEELDEQIIYYNSIAEQNMLIGGLTRHTLTSDAWHEEWEQKCLTNEDKSKKYTTPALHLFGFVTFR